MVTFNKEVLDMCNERIDAVKALSGASVRITLVKILAGLRVILLCLGLEEESTYCATGGPHLV